VPNGLTSGLGSSRVSTILPIACAVAVVMSGCGTATEQSQALPGPVVAVVSATTTPSAGAVADDGDGDATDPSDAAPLGAPDSGAPAGAGFGGTSVTPDSDGDGSEATEATADGGQAAAPSPTRPDWLGTRVLTTNAEGIAAAQPTPPELIDRRLPTIDTLPPPTSDTFEWSVGPLTGDPLARSTWTEDCPVERDELRYLRLTFWGFDDRPHQGELIVNQEVVDDIAEVFRALYEARFPIEEMRIVTQADVDAPPTGDGNNTTAFVCRPVVGGSRFSEHAYGLAIDVNPFQNPYRRGEVVLPELATSYLDRDPTRAGVITEDGVVVQAFDAIGWGWGGRWSSLDDYHHFALNDR
jgi:hypothetical protein